MKLEVYWCSAECLGDGEPFENGSSRCNACLKTAWVDVSKTPYLDSMQRLSDSWDAEREGVWLLDEGLSSRLACRFLRILITAMSREITFISKEIEKLLEFFPDTLWPIAHLHRRLARLLLHIPEPRMTDINHALECLDTSFAAMREWNNDEARPITLALLVEKITAHFEAVKVVMSEMRGWKHDSRVRAHLEEARETWDTAKEDARDLYGNDGAVMKDLVDGWGRKLEKLERGVMG